MDENPYKYNFLTHCITKYHLWFSFQITPDVLSTLLERKITLNWYHFSRVLSVSHLDEKKTSQDLSITHMGEIGIETLTFSWSSLRFSTFRLWFSITMSQTLNKMSNIIWLWIPMMYDCPWIKTDSSAFLCQICTYLTGRFIKLCLPTDAHIHIERGGGREREGGKRERGRKNRVGESMLPSAGLVSWSSFDLMALRFHKENSYVLEAKTTVQRSPES